MKSRIILFILAAVVALTSGSMVGGVTEISMKDVGARKALQAAVEQHNRQSNNMCLTTVQQVIKVESQVVEGLLYRIKVIMASTSCRNPTTAVQCAINEDPEKAQLFECTFEVWVREWMTPDPITVQHTSCS
ncbi:cystatin-like [Notolabrus celidotus]|uniref:cystatin-like n=1 Tax=Notolabrus celidotus TaxID=1203425 RepID=UPI0014900EEA|nr:cystatin-like [Notolabrus celidotus]